ncbi:hypothetical protein DRO53_05150 [Candidatus Bathyarchaeota archaeon]|nr:MAG: hypothetical protein DRO53_05150 [Candidatus Bathyarchaeota archaeon]
MGSLITLVSAPKLRSRSSMVAEFLEKLNYDALFLDFSREIEEYVKMLAEGLPYSYVIGEIRRQGLIPESVANSWEYQAEPILRKLQHLKRLNPSLDIHCYGASSYEHLAAHIAVKIALLTLRSMTTRKVNPEAWRRLLEEEAKASRESLEDEADLLADRASKHPKNTCVYGVPYETFREKLAERRVQVRVIEVDPNYQPTPMEVLKREVALGTATDERIVQLVQAHVEYVRNYVLPSGSLDEAYERWVKAKRLEFKGGGRQSPS